MTPIKEYQSNRNRYTKQLVPVSGRTATCSGQHWWGRGDRCVMCGASLVAEADTMARPFVGDEQDDYPAGRPRTDTLTRRFTPAEMQEARDLLASQDQSG